ncbi:sel1 repeat family protein, partial [bacterium]|nr:sel1 repeat family protein [bacterium]
WYRKAAEQENVNAQFELGFMYALGNGVAQDYVLAHMWLNLSVAQGHKDAREGRDLVAERMTSEQIASAQRMAREFSNR